MDQSVSELFVKGSRQKLRFDVNGGVFMIEDLWDLPLTTTKANGRSLDNVARELDAEIKEGGDNRSFVDEGKTNPALDEVKLKFDIVMAVIQVKKAERAEAATQAEKKAAKEKLLDALARRQDANLEQLTEEELRARIEAL